MINIRKFISPFLLLFFFSSCSMLRPNLRLDKEYLWTYKTNSDRTISIDVSGTRHINYHDKDAINQYQQGAFQFAKNAAYSVCPSGYAINRAIKVDYQSEDCNKKSYVDVRAINAGEEPLPSYCTFPVFDLTVTCNAASSIQSLPDTQNQTVVLGNADPDVIRSGLMKALPQMRYCYQRKMEETGIEYRGVVRLEFTIGPEGEVLDSRVTDQNSIPEDINSCVAEVVSGLKFPPPLGGGTVEVKQPINFYPKAE